MRKRPFLLKKINASPLARNITLVISGNLFTSGLGAISALLVSRYLSVGDFGLFSLALSIMYTATFLTELGTNTSMVKFASSYLGAGRTAEASHVFRVIFRTQLAAILIVAGTMFFLANSFVRFFPTASGHFRATSSIASNLISGFSSWPSC
ncbi:MAG: oligosaccharide flippase family protein [Candidatus Aminicenantales bacterium]